mgnify:CR=1 FL=1
MSGFLYMLVMGAVGINHLVWLQPPYKIDQETQAMISHMKHLRNVENRPDNNSETQWFI